MVGGAAHGEGCAPHPCMPLMSFCMQVCRLRGPAAALPLHDEQARLEETAAAGAWAQGPCHCQPVWCPHRFAGCLSLAQTHGLMRCKRLASRAEPSWRRRQALPSLEQPLAERHPAPCMQCIARHSTRQAGSLQDNRHAMTHKWWRSSGEGRAADDAQGPWSCPRQPTSRAPRGPCCSLLSLPYQLPLLKTCKSIVLPWTVHLSVLLCSITAATTDGAQGLL